MAAIIVLGSLNMDLVAVASRLPAPGETLLGSQFITIPGGKGANQAYAAACLGGDVAMLGRIGSDAHGQQMLANLEAAGCDVSAVGEVEGPSGVALIFVDDAGQNSILVVPGANGRYLPGDFETDKLHLDGAKFLLLQLETPLETVIAAAQAAKRQGTVAILDPAPAMASIPSVLLRCVDILTPNESEACQLTGRPMAQLTQEEATNIGGKLLALGAESLILKLGHQGCMVIDRGAPLLIPAEEVAAVDTTAAGDMFNGALAVALSDGASLVEAARFAVGAATLSVTRLGAQQSMPDRAALEAWAENGSRP